MQGDIFPFGLRRNPVWRDSSNVKRERAVGDGYGIERMGSDRGILLGVVLYFSHFLSVLMGFLLVRWRGISRTSLGGRWRCRTPLWLRLSIFRKKW